MLLEDKAVLSTFFAVIKSFKEDHTNGEMILDSDPTASSAITHLDAVLFNSVGIKQPVDNSKLIAELINKQRDLNYPLTAWITAETKAAGLEQMLKDNFECPGPFYGMVLDLKHAKSYPQPQHIHVEEIKTPEQAEMFGTTLADVFNFPTVKTRYIKWANQQLEIDQPISINFIAKINDEIAGASSLFLDKTFRDFKVGGFYNACVVPKFRKQGVGMAMACHRIKIAKELGLDYLSILLMSDAMARGYCEKVGFKNYHTMTPYYIKGN